LVVCSTAGFSILFGGVLNCWVREDFVPWQRKHFCDIWLWILRKKKEDFCGLFWTYNVLKLNDSASDHCRVLKIVVMLKKI